MKVLVILLAMFLVCWACGAMLSSLFSRRDDDAALYATYGYAYTHVMFYAMYMAAYSVELACILVLGVPALLSGGLAVVRAKRAGGPGWLQGLLPRPGAPGLRQSRFLWAAGIALSVVLLASWPHVSAGWGNYWHSGNHDLDDGLRGREAYLGYKIFDNRPFDLGVIMGDSAIVELKQAARGLNNKQERPWVYREWYAGDYFRFQYSSLAFWSGLFQEPYGLDMELVQMLLGLVLMALGVFDLCQASFAMSRKAAAVTALCSACNVFYLTTYYSGHVGSLMYGAFAPALLRLGLGGVAETLEHRRRLFFLVLLTVAAVYSYVHPVLILAVPLALYHILSAGRTSRLLAWLRMERAQHRVRLALLLLALLALGGLCGVELWTLTEGYRLRALDYYRAWGYALHPIILPLLLGLLPSPVVGSGFLGSSLVQGGYLALTGAACAMAACLVRFYVRQALVRSRFLAIFGLCWVAWCLFFIIFVRDSYYLYKFLYTQQFVLIIGIACHFASGEASAKTKVLLIALLLANLAGLGYAGWDLYRRPYNGHPERYKALLQIPPAHLRESFLDFTGGDRIAVRQWLLQLGIKPQADQRNARNFMLSKAGPVDITSSQLGPVVDDAGPFVLMGVPDRNFLFVRTWFDPEVFPRDAWLRKTSFRWAGHRKSGVSGIFVARPTPASEMVGRFLRICYQAGPSAVGPVDISVTSSDRQLLHREVLLGHGPTCTWIPAEKALQAKLPLFVSSEARGKGILPYDDRILLYRVFEVNWADQPFDQQIAPLFNAAEDIVEPGGGPATLQLRLGWESLERGGGERFRWVGDAAEIVTSGDADRELTCRLDVEPGPSLGSKPCVLELVDDKGAVVFKSGVLTGRTTIDVPLRVGKGSYSIYRLMAVESDNRPVPGDIRRLNFRVFRIWQGHG